MTILLTIDNLLADIAREGDAARTEYLATMVTQYLATAVWSSHTWSEEGDCGESLQEEGYDEDCFSASAVSEAHDDCAAFYDANLADLLDIEAGQAGHDFWLTRNGHGTGFWDRGNAAIGERLADAARVYGECDVTVDDNNELVF
jgi:hypothetical protein